MANLARNHVTAPASHVLLSIAVSHVSPRASQTCVIGALQHCVSLVRLLHARLYHELETLCGACVQLDCFSIICRLHRPASSQAGTPLVLLGVAVDDRFFSTMRQQWRLVLKPCFFETSCGTASVVRSPAFCQCERPEPHRSSGSSRLH